MTRMHAVLVAVAVVVLTWTAPPRAQQSSEARALQEAIDLIESKGDYAAALAKLDVAAKSSDRAVAARALWHTAQVLERTDADRAVATYRRIVSDFADQGELAAASRQRIGALSGPPPPTGVMPRLICELCADFYGSVSRDGRFMATVSPFLGGENTGDIGLLDLASQTLTPLHIDGSGKTPTGLALAPFFAPDGRQIAYLWLQQATRSAELRIVGREGGRPRVVVSNPEIVYIEPQGWSSNGTLLVLVTRPDRTWELAVVSDSTGALTRVKSLGWRIAAPQHESSLSPDGQYIAYAALTTNPAAPLRARDGDNVERQIYVVAADGASEVAITTGTGVKRHPIWTPDGRHLLYLSNVGGLWGLWAMPMRAGRPAGQAMLVRNELDVVPLGMTSTGGYHFYQGRAGVIRTAVVRLDSTGAGARPVGEAFVGALPSWSPDGRAIAVARQDASGAREIVVRTLGSGDERAFTRPAIDSFPFTWFPDGRRVLFQARDGQQPAWFRVDVESGDMQRLAPVVTEAFRAHGNVRALSSDGRTLYLGTSVSEGEQVFDRISALDLETGARRDVFRLPIDGPGLPRVAQDIALAASPDGRSLAIFFRDRTIDRVRLATVGVDGRSYRELTEPVDARNIRTKLVWSRDGRWIYFTSVAPAEGVTSADGDVHQVMRVPATGGTPEFTGVTIDGLERFDLSPDGAHLAYSTLRPEGWGELLWTLDVAAILAGRR